MYFSQHTSSYYVQIHHSGALVCIKEEGKQNHWNLNQACLKDNDNKNSNHCNANSVKYLEERKKKETGQQ